MIMAGMVIMEVRGGEAAGSPLFHQEYLKMSTNSHLRETALGYHDDAFPEV